MIRFFDLLCLFSTMLLEMGGRRWVKDLRLKWAIILEFSDTAGKIMNVVIATIRGKLTESSIKTQKVVLVQAAGPLTAEDVLRELLGILRTDELLVVRSADINQSTDRRGAIGRMEWGVVYSVAVDLANIEVFLDLSNFVRDDTVGNAPNSLWSRVVMVG
jgi:hypothetical protein